MSNINNTRIAKNTLFLYVRMFIILVIALFTSRVILDKLGASDFGIYQVVGGIVAMFSFLNDSLAGASSRFLTYELGKGDNKQLKKVFSTSLLIHYLLALVIFLLAESIGLWYIENKIVVPIERMNITRIVYQLSVLSSVIKITQVPYNAVIIAREKMNVFAMLSLLDSVLKLLICYLLFTSTIDKLLLYSILLLIEVIFIRILYQIYSVKNFFECRFNLVKDKILTKSILSFSGWDLIGNFSVMARGHGVNLILNLFFGTIANAASGIALQVGTAINSFSGSFLTAARPQIVKLYAKDNINEMETLMINSAKFAYSLLLLLSLPFLYKCEFILNIWLKEVPEYTIMFCKLSVLLSLVSVPFNPIMYAIHATGRIKRMSLLNGTVWVLILPLSYILLKFRFSANTPFVLKIFIMSIIALLNLYTLKHNMPQFNIGRYIKEVVLPCLYLTGIAVIPSYYINIKFSTGWLGFIIVLIFTTFIVSISVFFIIMKASHRNLLIQKIKNFF